MESWSDKIQSRGKLKPLTKEQQKVILHKVYYKLEDRQVNANEFFTNRGWEIRQNTFDYLYKRYTTDKMFRLAVNGYLIEGLTWEDHVYIDMAQVILRKQNFILELTGPTGSGKSRLAFYLLQSYNFLMKHGMRIVLDPRKTDRIIDNDPFTFETMSRTYLTYSNSETTTVFREQIEKWDSGLQDETPHQHGKGSQIEKHGFANVVAVAMRRNCISLIILNPTIVELENINYYIEVVGIRSDTFETCAILYDKTCSPLGIAIFQTIIAPEVWDPYEIESEKRKTEILRTGGFSGVYVSDEELQPYVETYLHWCRTHDVTTVQQVRMFVPRCMELASYPHSDIVAEMVWVEMLTARQHARDAHRQDQEDHTEPETVPEPEYAEDVDLEVEDRPHYTKFGTPGTFALHVGELYEQMGEVDQEVSYILQWWLTGLTFGSIMRKLNEELGTNYQSESTIQDKISNLRGPFIGNAWETFKCTQLGIEPGVGGGQGDNPDIVVASSGSEHWNYLLYPDRPYTHLEVYSCKFRADTRPAKFEVFGYGENGCYPEAMFCIQHQLEYFTIAFYNLMNTARNRNAEMFEECAIDVQVKPLEVRSVRISVNNTFKLIKGRGSGNKTAADLNE
jgi:hypothetical protein